MGVALTSSRLACLVTLMLLGACASRVPTGPNVSPAVVFSEPPGQAIPKTVPLEAKRTPPGQRIAPGQRTAPGQRAAPIQPADPVATEPQDAIQVLSFDDLDGWDRGDHVPALIAMRLACNKLTDIAADTSIGGLEPNGAALFGTGGEWSSLCRDSLRTDKASNFFEENFVPVALGGAEKGTALFTAYYEPELNGSRVRGGPYQFPLYARPDDLVNGVPYFDRAAIDAGALDGRGLEIFWLADPIESFFLHIQGSGRIRLPDGSVARVGFAGKNGHAYKAIGKSLVEWGEMDVGGVSKRSIEEWIAAHPDRRDELLGTNPSYVFFTERKELNADPSLGPVGAFGLPLPSSRSIAIDPRYYALGAPAWVELDTPVGPMHRLVLALDTGGAIKGSRRADFFFGSGDGAGKAAGSTRDFGRLIALVPRTAYERIFGPLS